MFFTCDPDWSASERIGRERQREREGARKKFKDPDLFIRNLLVISMGEGAMDWDASGTVCYGKEVTRFGGEGYGVKGSNCICSTAEARPQRCLCGSRQLGGTSGENRLCRNHPQYKTEPPPLAPTVSAAACYATPHRTRHARIDRTHALKRKGTKE